MFILIIVFVIFTCWKHVYRLYVLLGTQEHLFEDDDQDLPVNYGTMTTSEPEDLPPKYEDIEELPPEYDESMMKPDYIYRGCAQSSYVNLGCDNKV